MNLFCDATTATELLEQCAVGRVKPHGRNKPEAVVLVLLGHKRVKLDHRGEKLVLVVLAAADFDPLVFDADVHQDPLCVQLAL